VAKRTIVLPGRGYSALGPAIRLPRLAVEQAGFPATLIDYPSEILEAQDMAGLVRAVRDQLSVLLDSDRPDHLLVLAKSLGTRVLTEMTDLVDSVENVSVIWLTPLFGAQEVRDGAASTGWRSLIVFGELDTLHDAEGVAAVQKALSADVLELASADHALEVADDVMATIAALSRLSESVLRFAQAADTATQDP
jgi:pimeloyl-ACP methyl ester carboxylesterase